MDSQWENLGIFQETSFLIPVYPYEVVFAYVNDFDRRFWTLISSWKNQSSVFLWIK